MLSSLTALRSSDLGRKHLNISSFIIRCFCLDHLSFPGCSLPSHQTLARANHTVVSPDSPCGPVNCSHVLICDHSPVTQRVEVSSPFFGHLCVPVPKFLPLVWYGWFWKNDKSERWTSGAFCNCCVLLT